LSDQGPNDFPTAARGGERHPPGTISGVTGARNEIARNNSTDRKRRNSVVNTLKAKAAGFGAIALVVTAMLAFPAAASVAAKDGDVIRTGNCSNNSDWKLKLSPEDGRIEVEFEVDSNVNGQTWNVKLKKDGNVFFSGQKTTKAPSGSFELRRVVNNGAGTETFVGRAKNPATGEVCRGTANF
jgi:hypothetical protein